MPQPHDTPQQPEPQFKPRWLCEHCLSVKAGIRRIEGKTMATYCDECACMCDCFHLTTEMQEKKTVLGLDGQPTLLGRALQQADGQLPEAREVPMGHGIMIMAGMEPALTERANKFYQVYRRSRLTSAPNSNLPENFNELRPDLQKAWKDVAQAIIR